MSQLTKKLRADLDDAAAAIRPSEGGWEDLLDRLEPIDDQCVGDLDPQ